MKILRTASLGSNFTGSYKKKSVFNKKKKKINKNYSLHISNPQSTFPICFKLV